MGNMMQRANYVNTEPSSCPSKVFGKIAMDAPLATQHRTVIINACPYVEADKDMRDAIILFNERLYMVDRQISIEIILDVAMFYTTYAQLLTLPSQHGKYRTNTVTVSLRELMDTRKRIFAKLEELSIKVSSIWAESAYAVIVEKMHGSLTSCTAALWHKHGFHEAVEMYYPCSSDPSFDR